MPFELRDIIIAQKELAKFRSSNNNSTSFHERFIFPFLCGSYFTYRKIDVIRIVTITKSVASTSSSSKLNGYQHPTYLDIGCGYGDFLERIREYIPGAEGIEKSAEIFYSLGRIKPDYIKISDAYHGIEKKYDVIFVGWMEPGVDYREKIAQKTDVIVTTLDQGLSLAIEFEEFGFEKVASWITPSWEDVNIELTNKYYSKIPDKLREDLANMRGAHNLWYVYSKPKYSKRIVDTLKDCLIIEAEKNEFVPFGFEIVLDDIGYKYFEMLKNPYTKSSMWEIIFSN